MFFTIYTTFQRQHTTEQTTMLIIFLLACFGVLWLAHRFSLLLSLPIETSVKTLSIPIPKVPLISVDKVADTTMVLHWSDVSSLGSQSSSDSESSASKPDRKDGINLKDVKDVTSSDSSNSTSAIISHYILYINGIETIFINGKQHKCTLDGLQPGTNYQIDLVAFNMAGFRSRSSPIYVKTSAKPIKEANMQSLENPDNVIKCLLHEQERASMTKNDPFKASITSGVRSRSGTLEGGHSNLHNHHHSESSGTKTKHPHLIDDINELKWILESGLEEVQSLMKSYKEAELEFEEEEINLISARNEARERRKYEDNNRTNLRQEIKLLEEQRVKSSSRISADEKKIKERMKKIENFNSQIEKWKHEITHMKKKREFVSKENPENLKKLEQDIITLNQEIFSSQTEVHEAEDDLRDEIAQRKALETQKVKVIQLFDEINKNINDVTGLLSKDGMETLNKLVELKPEWKDELLKEIVEIDEKAESDWKALQQKEWLNFNKMKNEIDEQNKLLLMKNSSGALNVNNPPTLTTSIGIENNPTTATNTTNVNGYLYNSLPSSSNNSVNGYNSQNYNSNSMRSIIRPRISASGSFHGSDMLPDKPNSQPDSTTNTFNSANNIWPMNLSLDSSAPNMINPANDSIESPTVNMLLPQNLIDDEAFDQLFETQSKNPASTGSINLMSPALSAVGIIPSGPTHQHSSSLSNGNSVSPNISQMNTFDVYQGNSINGLVLNSTPQNNIITSLGALASGNSQSSMMANSAPLNMIGSPQSLNAYLANDNGLSANFLDLSHAATTSPFNSNSGMNLKLTSTNTNPDMDGSSSIFNPNSVLMGGSLGDSKQYSKIFGSLNGPSNSTITSDANGKTNNNLDFSISRGRSTSFGSSIWSNGNTGNPANNGAGTWGSKTKPGFSFLGAPITMTSTESQKPNTILGALDKDNENSIFNNPAMNNDSNHRVESKEVDSFDGDDDDDHPNSPSFLKSMMEKFGASPTKTISNKTFEHVIDEYDDTVEEQVGKNSHHKSTSLGSSRFFKLSRKNSVVSGATGSTSSGAGSGPVTQFIVDDEVPASVGSTPAPPNSGGGFMGRKLSFAFKRDHNKD